LRHTTLTIGDKPHNTPKHEGDDPVPAAPSTTDEGQPSLAINATAGALGQVVYLLTGFVLPRLLNDRLGTEMLGVWDFGWSMVAHLMLVSLGMTAAVNRNVARFTGTGDIAELRSLTSTCFMLFMACAAVVVAATLGIAHLVPRLLTGLSPELFDDARWVVLLLGLSIALRFAVHVCTGIITGYQRYVLHNLIGSGAYFASTVLMVIFLLSGYGVVAMAASFLGGEAVAGALRVWFANRICPHWRISPRYIRRATVKHVVAFGGKTLLGSVSRVLLYQTNTVLIGYYLGAEALAIFARPRSLVLAFDRILRRVVMVLTPRASQLQALGDNRAIAETLSMVTRYSLFLAVPIVATFIILGEPLLQFWMGDKFVEGGLIVLVILAAGHLASFAQRGAYSMLMGMARHGLAAATELGGAVLGIVLALIFLGPLHLGLVWAAVALVLPLTLVNGLLLPAIACKVVGLPLRSYIHGTLVKPLVLTAPYAVILLIVRALPLRESYWTLLVALSGGGTLYVWLLWRYALDPALRRRLVSSIRRIVNKRRADPDAAGSA